MKKRTLLLIIIAALLIGGLYYIYNYTRLLSKNNIYYGYFTNVRGLQSSSPVYIQGVKVGKVDEIDLNIREKVRVIFAIDKAIVLPSDTRAVITSGDVSGSKAIRLETGKGTGIIAPGGTLATGFDSSMIESFNAKITPALHNGKMLLKSADSALFNFNQLVITGWGNQTQNEIARFDKVTGNFATATGKANQRIQNAQKLVDDLEHLTGNPADKNADVNNSMANAEEKTAQAVKAPADKRLQELRNSINSFSASIGKLGRNKILDDSVSYKNAVNSLDTFDRSMKEYMKAPPPLINIFSSGKKK